MDLEWDRDRTSAYIKYEVGIILRDLTYSANDGFGGSTLSSTPVTEALDQWTETMPLRVPAHDATADKRTKRHLLVGRRKGCRPDGVSAELLKITLNGNPALRRRLLDIVVRIWRVSQK